jgi:hypothetical protein
MSDEGIPSAVDDVAVVARGKWLLSKQGYAWR